MEQNHTIERPVIITFICLVGFMSSLFLFYFWYSTILRPYAPGYEGWYRPYIFFSAIIGLIMMIGIWHMKKWAVYLYILITAIDIFILVYLRTWSFSIVIKLATLGILLFHFNKFEELNESQAYIKRVASTILLVGLGFLVFWNAFFKEYLAYQDADTIQKCQQYLATYPNGIYKEKITLRLEDKIYIAATQAAKNYDCSKMDDYLNRYPKGRYRTAARKSLEQCRYEYAAADQNIAALDQFILDYPTSAYIKKAVALRDYLLEQRGKTNKRASR
ncbi:hypothetical protein [Rhodoflexus sp.]